ncbi:MAG: hypothetical protein CMM07_19800 [Rhodopirellula sp.]|nr:hypothetical protein [Rhodopirellula sp.]
MASTGRTTGQPLFESDCMKNVLLILTFLSGLAYVGCGPDGNTVVAPSDNALTAEEAKTQAEDDQMREEYESGGDRQ